MVEHMERTLYGKPKSSAATASSCTTTGSSTSRTAATTTIPACCTRSSRLQAESPVGGRRHAAGRQELAPHHLHQALHGQGRRRLRLGMFRAMKQDYGLKDPSLIDQWMEYPTNHQLDPEHLSRLRAAPDPQLARHAPVHHAWTHECELVWTLLGFEDDTAEQTNPREAQQPGRPRGTGLDGGREIGSFVQKAIAATWTASRYSRWAAAVWVRCRRARRRRRCGVSGRSTGS